MTTPSFTSPISSPEVISRYLSSASASPIPAVSRILQLPPVFPINSPIFSVGRRINSLALDKPLPKEPLPVVIETIYHSQPKRVNSNEQIALLFKNKPNLRVCLTADTLLTLGKWMNPLQFKVKKGEKLHLHTIDLTDQIAQRWSISFNPSHTYQGYLMPTDEDLNRKGQASSEKQSIQRLFHFITRETKDDLPQLVGENVYSLGCILFLSPNKSIQISQAVFAFLRELKADAVQKKQHLLNTLFSRYITVMDVARIVIDYLSSSQLERLEIPEALPSLEAPPKTGLARLFSCCS
jgi:hypothetical protein